MEGIELSRYSEEVFVRYDIHGLGRNTFPFLSVIEETLEGMCFIVFCDGLVLSSTAVCVGTVGLYLQKLCGLRSKKGQQRNVERSNSVCIRPYGNGILICMSVGQRLILAL